MNWPFSTFDPFMVNVPILHPLKTPGNLWFYGVFRGYKIRKFAINELIETVACKIHLRWVFACVLFFSHIHYLQLFRLQSSSAWLFQSSHFKLKLSWWGSYCFLFCCFHNPFSKKTITSFTISSFIPIKSTKMD